MIRQFYLENNYGIRWGLNDPSTGLLVSPDGLGYERDSNYLAIGHSFVRNYMKEKQGSVTGVIVFGTQSPYVACNKFLNFVNATESLKLVYVTDVGEYYREIDLVEFGKSEIGQYGVLECGVTFVCKGLFYSNKAKRFVISRVEGEMRWDFTWPVRFNDYESRNIAISNDGHVPATFDVEIYGYCENPTISLVQSGAETQKVIFPITIQVDEKILYSAVDGNLYCVHVDADGVETNLADLLDLNQSNFFKIPVGDSLIQIDSDTASTNRTVLTIYKYYRAV